MQNSSNKMLHHYTDTTISPQMSVLERQQERLKWPQEQKPIDYFNENEQFLFGNSDQGIGELLMGRAAMKPDPGMDIGLNVDDFGFGGRVLNYGNGSDFGGAGYGIPRTVSCPPAVAAAMAEMAAGEDGGPGLVLSSAAESFRKRKADKNQNVKVAEEARFQDKKMKGSEEEESSKITQEFSNCKSTTTNVGNKKAGSVDKSNAPRPDYIHVRARRGQATDSHSLAERVRREKISERMKYLQDLVPGCNRITGKAGMLDEIINYVQSLQRQVEFLSMKLAAINPGMDLDVDNYLSKEMFPASEPRPMNPVQLQFNALGQEVPCSGVDISTNCSDAMLRRTISAPITIPQPTLDSSCYNPVQNLTWDVELQNLLGMDYHQGRSPPFVSQPFTGYIESGHVKLEM